MSVKSIYHKVSTLLYTKPKLRRRQHMRKKVISIWLANRYTIYVRTTLHMLVK